MKIEVDHEQHLFNWAFERENHSTVKTLRNILSYDDKHTLKFENKKTLSTVSVYFLCLTTYVPTHLCRQM